MRYGRGGVSTLKCDGVAAVDADLGGEALDVRVAGAAHVPVRGTPGLAVLADDRVDDRRVARARRVRGRGSDERDEQARASTAAAEARAVMARASHVCRPPRPRPRAVTVCVRPPGHRKDLRSSFSGIRAPRAPRLREVDTDRAGAANSEVRAGKWAPYRTLDFWYMRALGVAIVGAGYWGPNLPRNFGGSADWDLRWICDLDLDRAPAWPAAIRAPG